MPKNTLPVPVPSKNVSDSFLKIVLYEDFYPVFSKIFALEALSIGDFNTIKLC